MTGEWIFVALALAVACAPLAFGAVHAWAYSSLATFICTLAVIWMLRAVLHSEVGVRLSGGRCGTAAGLCAIWLALSVVPWPPALLHLLAPANYVLFAGSLPGWPAGAGYSQLGPAAAMSLWRSPTLSPFLARIELLKLLSYVVTFLIAAYYPTRDDSSTARLLLRVLIAVALVEATYTLVQDASGSTMIYGFQKPIGAHWPSGTYINRNHLAGLLAMITPIAACLAMETAVRIRRRMARSGRHATGTPWAERLSTALDDPDILRCALYAALTTWLAAGLYRSLSRAGILCPIAAACLLAPLLRTTGAAPSKRTRRNLLAPAAALLTGIIALAAVQVPELSTRLSDQEIAGAVAGRVSFLRDSLSMVARFPLFGIGLGNFEYTFPAFRSAGGGQLTHVHNDYVELAVEAGLPVLLLALALLVGLYRRALLTLRTPGRDRLLLWGTLVGVTACLLHATVDFNLHIPANALVFSLLAGLVVRLSAPSSRHDVAARHGTASRLRPALALAGMLVVLSFTLPAARAETSFRRWFSDSTLTSTIAREAEPSPQARSAALRHVLEFSASHPFAHYQLGIEIEARLKDTWGSPRTTAQLRNAAAHFAAAARALPQWAPPHLQLGILATVGTPGLTADDAAASLDRAGRLDPYNRGFARAVARARRALNREGVR